MIRNIEGDLLTPSVVLFDDAEIVVGKEAKNAVAVKPDRVAQWVKRDMGSPVYSRPIRGEYLPPEVIQACVLRKLKADILYALGPDFGVVITVPAYFDEPRRQATVNAGEMAGLNVLDIVNEPTAAALAFGETLGYLTPDRTGAKTAMAVMVYDLGGGTFDATMLQLAPGDIRTLATDGDVQLGGHDWDLRLLNLVAESFKQFYGVDPRDDPPGLNRLYNSVVEAKHALSARSRVTIRVEQGQVSGEIQVTREQFEEITADLLDRTAYTTRQLLEASKLSWSDVQRVLLVGGSTRMPMVQRMLLHLTQFDPAKTVNPDEAVARGAAIYAGHLLAAQEGGGHGASFQVTNVNAHSLGVQGIEPQTLRKTNVVLIPRNSPLPARFTERFVTKSDSQRSIVVQVLEGEKLVAGRVYGDRPGGDPGPTAGIAQGMAGRRDLRIRGQRAVAGRGRGVGDAKLDLAANREEYGAFQREPAGLAAGGCLDRRLRRLRTDAQRPGPAAGGRRGAADGRRRSGKARLAGRCELAEPRGFRTLGDGRAPRSAGVGRYATANAPRDRLAFSDRLVASRLPTGVAAGVPVGRDVG